MNIRKWARSDRGKNKGLIVWYAWEGKAKRKATVFDASGYWSVRFADRPDVAKQGTIEYTYVFELGDADKKTLEDATVAFKSKSAIYAASVAEAQRNAIATEAEAKADPNDVTKLAASNKAKLDLQSLHSKEFPDVISALAPLDGFTDDEGNAAKDVLLRAAGFEPDSASNNGWKPSHLSAVFAAKTAQEDTKIDTAKQAQGIALAALSGADACVTAAKSAPATTETDAAGYTTCSIQLRAALAPEASFPSALAALTILDTQVAAFKANPNEATLRAVTSARSNLGASVVAPNPTPPAASSNPLNAIKALVNHMTVSVVESQATARRKDTLSAKIDETRLTLSTAERATDILKQEGSRRDFDVASGVVYVADLDEWVVPTFIAWCPWGCHRPDAGFDRFRNWFSVDAGLRTTMIDSGSKVDPRHDTGTVSPMLGVSLNPASFFRASVGSYYFNNKESGNWNFRPYFGITLDIVRLGEITKLIGLGDPPTPKLEPAPTP